MVQVKLTELDPLSGALAIAGIFLVIIILEELGLVAMKDLA